MTHVRGVFIGANLEFSENDRKLKEISEKVLNAPMICMHLVRYSMHVQFGVWYMPSYYPQNIALKVSWELN